MLVSDIEYDNEFIEQGLNSPFYIPNADKTLVTNKGYVRSSSVISSHVKKSRNTNEIY